MAKGSTWYKKHIQKAKANWMKDNLGTCRAHSPRMLLAHKPAMSTDIEPFKNNITAAMHKHIRGSEPCPLPPETEELKEKREKEPEAALCFDGIGRQPSLASQGKPVHVPYLPPKLRKAMAKAEAARAKHAVTS